MFALFVACAVFPVLAAQKQKSLAFISSDLMRFITLCSAMEQRHPLAAFARRMFEEHSDFHVTAQDEKFLVHHKIAKAHGKGKCKHARLIMNFGNLIHA